MESHTMNKMILSLLKLIQLGDTADTMKSSAKELQRQYIEHLMSFKGLKLLGIRSSCMISCRALKILKGFTVKSIS
uniref:Uncharacterized protein n=1 Tax=Lotus japonicus TaxID=34305 RepID=I3S948_LOTJA|nr:unknown [Lotus japonicus]